MALQLPGVYFWDSRSQKESQFFLLAHASRTLTS